MARRRSSIESLLEKEVVLDTAGPFVYLGILKEVQSDGYWLETADIRDQSEGHVSKERYICEARANGIVSNRRRIFVCASAVVSFSALEDVIL